MFTLRSSVFTLAVAASVISPTISQAYVDCYGSLANQLCFRVCEHSVWKLVDKGLKTHTGKVVARDDRSFLAEDHNGFGPKVTLTLQNTATSHTCSMTLQKHSQLGPRMTKAVTVENNTCQQYGARDIATLGICLNSVVTFFFADVKRFDMRSDGHGLCIRDGFVVPEFAFGTGSGIVTFNPDGASCHDPDILPVQSIEVKKPAD